MIAVLEWRAWDGFLLASLCPAAVRVPARIGETAPALERRIPASTSRFVFHVDLTDTARVPLDRPALVERLEQRGVVVINGALTDISKRRVQSACAACGLAPATAGRSGDPAEPLIIKTDRNFGGQTEALLDGDERAVLGLRDAPRTPAADALAGSIEQGEVLGLGDAPRTPAGEPVYAVMARRDVPAEMWQSPDHVVERFITNATSLFFRAYVLRERMVISAAIDRRPIKRLQWGLPRRQFYFIDSIEMQAPPQAYDLEDLRLPPGLPESVRAFCGELQLDYGAIDVVMDDAQRCSVIDANSTPSWGRPDMREIVDFLAPALW